MELVGDATGTTTTMVATMDPRFCSLISYVTFEVEQITKADKSVSISIQDSAMRTPPQFESEIIVATTAAIGPPEVAKTWIPVPIVLGGGSVVPTIEVRCTNVDLDKHFLSVLVYIFDIRVREMTPMGPLLWARGST